jgi:hypothetical protein
MRSRCWARGCTDIDLISASTNTIPIRRLGLAVGETAEVGAAWLRFPVSTLSLEQRYTRLEEGLYRYESGGGRSSQTRVNGAGFVTDCGCLDSRSWHEVIGSGMADDLR